MTTFDLTDGSPELRIYLLAAEEDREACGQVRKYLAPLTLGDQIRVRLLDDFTSTAGDDVELGRARLDEADVVMSLVTADFIDDNTVYRRGQQALERYNARDVLLITVLLEHCLWSITPFANVPVLPSNRKPVSSRKVWESDDEALGTVATELHALLSQLAEIERSAPPERAAAAPVASTVTAERAAPVADPPSPTATPEVADGPDSPPEETAADGRITTDGPTSGEEIAAGIVGAPPAPPAEPTGPPGDIDLTDGSTADAPVEAATAVRVRVDDHAPVATEWRSGVYRSVIGRRIAAYLVDSVLLFVTAVVLSAIFVPLDTGNESAEDQAIAGIFALLVFGALPLMEAAFGATPGKRLLGLHVTDRTGSRVGFGHALLRNVVRSVYTYACIFIVPLVYQWFRFKKKNRLIHDELTRTVIGPRP